MDSGGASHFCSFARGGSFSSSLAVSLSLSSCVDGSYNCLQKFKAAATEEEENERAGERASGRAAKEIRRGVRLRQQRRAQQGYHIRAVLINCSFASIPDRSLVQLTRVCPKSIIVHFPPVEWQPLSPPASNHSQSASVAFQAPLEAFLS